MWNDIVKANCARANTTASQPSNIAPIHRSSSWREPTTPDATIEPAPCAEQGLSVGYGFKSHATVRSICGARILRHPQTQSDPAGGHPGRVVGGFLGG